MNINERIEALEKELAELKAEVSKPKKWDMNNGWLVFSDGGIVPCGDLFAFNTDDPAIEKAFKRGRVFRTKEEAEFFAEKELVRAELEALADDDKEWGGNNRHWCIRFEYDVVFLDYMVSGKTDIPYFKSKESAEKAIAAVGEDRIKKYLFGKGSNNED